LLARDLFNRMPKNGQIAHYILQLLQELWKDFRYDRRRRLLRFWCCLIRRLGVNAHCEI
jgi:hypothetical protein